MIKLYLNISYILILTCTSIYAAGSYYDAGCSYYIYKKYDKAKEMFLKAAEAGDYGNAYYFLGEIEKIQGNYDESEKYLKIAVTKKSIDRKYLTNAYWNLIVLYDQKGDYDTVIKTCKDMWVSTRDEGARRKIESMINQRLWSDNKEAVDKYKEALDRKERGKTDEAMTLFREAMSLDSNFLAPKFEIGMNYYRRGNLDEAADRLSEISHKINFYGEVHLILGDIYFTKKYYSRAAEHLTSAFDFAFLDKKNEYQLYIKRGTCYFNTGDYDRAGEDIEKSLVYKKTLKAMLLLSSIKIKKNDTDGALDILQKTGREFPDNREILFQTGSLYYKKDDVKYVSCFDRLFDLSESKKDDIDRYHKAFHLLAKHHFEDKNYPRVVKIAAALPARLKNNDLRLISGRAYYYLKNYEKAAETLEKLSLERSDEVLLCSAYARYGREDRAKKIILDSWGSESFMRKARDDKSLGGIILNIENEKKAEEKIKNGGDNKK